MDEEELKLGPNIERKDQNFDFCSRFRLFSMQWHRHRPRPAKASFAYPQSLPPTPSGTIPGPTPPVVHHVSTEPSCHRFSCWDVISALLGMPLNRMIRVSSSHRQCGDDIQNSDDLHEVDTSTNERPQTHSSRARKHELN
jgi:hypothetical protein